MPPTREVKERKEKRQRRVEQLLAMQMTTHEVQRQVCEEFGVSRRTVRNDIQGIYIKWDREATEDKPFRRHQMRQSMRAIMQRAVGDGQWNVAIQALDRLCRLDGLFEPMKAQVSHTGTVDLRNMTSDDKRRRLEELMSKASSVRPGSNGIHKGKNGVN